MATKRKTLVMISLIAFGPVCSAIRDASILQHRDVAAQAIAFMSTVNVLSLLPTSILVFRNNKEIANVREYIDILLASCVLPLLYASGAMLGLVSADHPYLVAVATTISIAMGFISHSLISAGHFYVARSPHLFQSGIIIIALASPLSSAPITNWWPQGLTLSYLLGAVVYLLVATTLNGSLNTNRHSQGGLGNRKLLLVIYVMSAAPAIAINLGQLIFFSRAGTNQLELTSIRASFYAYSLLTLPIGYLVGKGRGKLPDKYRWLAAACSMIFIPLGLIGGLIGPFFFAAGVTVFQYFSRSEVVSLTQRHSLGQTS